ncbi:Precorrin-6A reductase [gamma proteobacterium HdN1]|nr:Precorrin-6A reductase [gamma proteobacterium HdN1]
MILGGTTQARELATLLEPHHPQLRTTLSLAGRTLTPAKQAGELRVGGFGGTAGLVQWLREQAVDILVDATHPFAATMSRHALAAVQETGIPLIVLERPPWQPVAGDHWIDVPDMEAAAAALGDMPQSVFLAIGRQTLAVFQKYPQHRYIIRSIEAPNTEDVLPNALSIFARGPFQVSDERTLFKTHGITRIVAKNSGADATEAKLIAARELGIPVLMVRRPLPRNSDATTAEDAMQCILNHLASGSARGE